MIYFTSDTHFGHKNIIKYCSRPWETVEEMNQALIDNWNFRVNKLDTVYFLGDFSFNSDKEYLDQLNGVKILIRGNHDSTTPKSFKAGWFDVKDEEYATVIRLDGEPLTIWMAHIPSDNKETIKREVVDGNYKNGLNAKRPEPHAHDIELCGHVHDKWKDNGKAINVGVDQWDYEPISLQEVLEYWSEMNAR